MERRKNELKGILYELSAGALYLLLLLLAAVIISR